MAALLAGAAALAFASRGREALAACAGLLVPVVLLVAGVPLAGVRALSGPPLLALALAGLALVVASAGRRPHRRLFLPLVFGVLVLAAARTHVTVGPEGDEPHYLMVADSLLRDGDLALERDFAEGRYRAFHDAPLEPHYRVRGRGGVIYSLHAVGLSVLILPAWALGGYAAVTVFLALVAALVAREVREWVRALTGRDGLAEAAGWMAALSPPLVHYAGLVFTEVPAALALSYGLRRGRDAGLGAAGAVSVGLAAAALPWLNVRYAPLALLVVAHALWRHPRVRVAAAVLGPAVVSGVGLLAYHQALYGFWNPGRVYGRRPEFALSALREGLPGLLLDQEFGLLVYAPALALAIPGFVFLWRRDRRLAATAGAAVAVVVLTAGTWHMWRGGFNPPARFLVPVVPLLAVAAALAWDRRGLTAGAALLVGWTLWTGLAGAWEPRLVHRDRDGTAPLLPGALGRPRVDGPPAGVRARRPRSPPAGGRVGPRPPGRPPLAHARGDARPRGGGGAGPRGGRSGGRGALALAHGRPRRHAPRGSSGGERCPAGSRSPRRRGSGRSRPSAGGLSTSPTGTRPGPSSAGACSCPRGDTGSRSPERPWEEEIPPSW